MSTSYWQNTRSMQPFGSTFSGETGNRLIDGDEYWVAFPEFAHCGAADKLTCTVPKP